MIKTWVQRALTLPPGTLVVSIETLQLMQAEIDDLRAALKAAESGPLSDEAFDIVTSENSALKAKLAELELQKGAQLQAHFEFDDCEEISITAYGTTRDMQLLEARLNRGLLADKKLAALESKLVAAGAAPARCPNCDDTGDVHSADGEWRGTCDCKATPVQQESVERNGELAYHNGRSAYELTKVPSSGWTLFGDLPTYAQAYWIAKAAPAPAAPAAKVPEEQP